MSHTHGGDPKDETSPIAKTMAMASAKNAKPSFASIAVQVGISSRFRLRGMRLRLIAFGVALLMFATIEILQLPRPPS